MEPIILFRNIPPTKENEEEIEIARKYFQVEGLITKCKNSLVIPRFSCLPYYQEFYFNLLQLGSIPINHSSGHNWAANFDWYEDLKEFTPESWTEQTFPDSTYQGPFVVKGCTNSRKHQWKTHMFAQGRYAAQTVASKLRNDMHLADQKIIFRKYVPLKTFEIGANGMPFSNEWRVFCYKNHILSHGYYWSILDDLKKPYMNEKGMELIQKITAKMGELDLWPIDFYVLDIAETEGGDWILIEVNDAQMSGLSLNDPDVMYSNLKAVVDFDSYCQERYQGERCSSTIP